MKRPGDEPSPSVQRASKLHKSVTFLLPHSDSTSSSKGTCTSSSSSGSSIRSIHSSSGRNSARLGNNNMTGGNSSSQPQHFRRQSSQSYSLDNNQLGGNSNNVSNTLPRASILRSASASSSSVASSSPRFTFDFVDDTSLGTSIASKRRPSSNYSGGGNHVVSPANHRHLRSGAATALSPSRLDARYSSRLPPSYNHNNFVSRSPTSRSSHRSYTSHLSKNEEIKCNLFGGSESGGGDTRDTTGHPHLDTHMDTDDFMDCSSGPDTPSSQQRSASFGTSSARTPNSLNSAGASPRFWTNHPNSPANRSIGGGLSVHTGASTSTARSTASTFMSISPRKRGNLTGVASPLSGNLSHASACSDASSPVSSIGGTSAMAADRFERRGAGDRFIPSRALSNFEFDLSVGNGTQRGNGGSGGSAGSSGRGNVSNSMGEIDADLTPTPSFGATMMGGGTVPDPSTASGTSPTGTTPADPAIASTFSDDAASESGAAERHDATNRQPLLYDALLRSELLGENVDPAMRSAQSPAGRMHPASGPNNGGAGNGGANNGGGAGQSVVVPFRERSNNLRFSPGRQYYQSAVYNHGANGEDGRSLRRQRHSSIVHSFGLTPVSMSPHQRTNLGSYTERCKRKIAKVPTKVLDAPALQDDFYLNLVDWSSQNVLAVGLGSCVYLWSAATSRVTQLCDLSESEDVVTSVAWSEGGKHLAIGSTRGDVQLWDAGAQKLARTMTGHSARVGALSWKLSGGGGSGAGGMGGHTGHGSNGLLASGSRDRLIHLRDPRSDSAYEMRLCGHKQEVCGLRWSFDDRSMLASGGNDNKLLVWDVKKHSAPIHTFADHTAAVKAIAWSPHQHGLLASGGGTADRCIRFWNCLTGHGINCIDTGSQVCNLAFSKNCNELVSTHGYSLNQIVVWKYPSMQKIATLTGHTYRVLYLALSPDGSTIVTGAGDETLRFWQVFPGPQKENKAGGLLFPAGMPGSVIR